MADLKDKNILLGITGGIAAYKSAFLVRHFIKAGAEVKVIMTASAKDFITPLTLSTLSKHKVYSDFAEGENQKWNNHVELGKWADVLCVAPATASTLSKMANGQADNFLLATYLSCPSPVFVAPAMDLDMYTHPSTALNLKKLEEFGNSIIPAESGELASGLVGQGRMAEPETIFRVIVEHLQPSGKLAGKRVLITAGPTHEAIDPVRFIGNNSSGKMGFALAEQAASKGAEIILVTGPTHLKTETKRIKTISVTTTDEMFNAVNKHFDQVDVFISSAAVSDYKPLQTADEKIKKNDEQLNLTLGKTRDILKTMGEKKSKQFLVGFAMETNNELGNAMGKLKKKNLDLIVLNSLRDEGAGFGTDTNKVKIISKDDVKEYDLKTKAEVAVDILNEISERLEG